MAKPEWGTKRICASCATRYYDLRRDPPTCPVCGSLFDPEALLRSRRARPVSAEDMKQVTAPPVRASDRGTDAVVGVDVDVVEDEVVLEDIEEAGPEAADDDEEVLIEDASELGEDEDMEDVVGVESEDDDSR